MDRLLARSVTASIAALVAVAAWATTPCAATTAPAPLGMNEPGAGVPGDTIPLPGLVVTATRVPMSPDALPTPVTVLTGQELRERGLRTVADALRTVPAASIIQAGPRGGQTSLFLRGGQSGYVKVLVDGVPVNDPGGAVDLADLSTDQVDRIEVVRGPASVLYGSDAVTGVVQIFTRRGQGAPSLTVTTRGGLGEQRHDEGRYGALDASATLTGSAGAMGYTVGGGRSWNDGAYPFNSDRRHDVLNGRLDWGTPATEIAVTARFSDSDTGFPTDGAGNLVDLNARLERRAWTAGVDVGHRLGDRVMGRIHVGLLDRDQLAVDTPDGPADTLGVFASTLHGTVRRLGADARLDLDLGGAVATLGAAVQDQRGTSSYEAESQWGPSRASAEFRRRNYGYYAQLLATPLESVDITAGARVDDNDVFGTFLTHRLGTSWRIGASRLRGALGRAFREPTFAESFGSGFGDRGNPDLLPERSRSWEVGLDQNIGSSLRLGATWFDQRFHDMIQYTFATAQADDPNYFNVGAAAARGLEVTADAALGRVLLSGSRTWLTTRVLDPGLATDASFAEGETLLRRPARSAAATARYRLDNGAISVTAHRTGQRDDLDFGVGFPAPRVALPAHTTVDLSAEHRIPTASGPDLHVLLRVDNALDADYESIRGFPAPGRLTTLGLRLGL